MPIFNIGDEFIAKGTAFPGSPATNDIFFRTDRAILYYYDGTRWLSVAEHSIPIIPYTGFSSNLSGTGTPLGTAVPSAAGTQIYVTKWSMAIFVATGSGYSATHEWDLRLRNRDSSDLASFKTFSDGGISSAAWRRVTRTVNSVRTVETDKLWLIAHIKVGTPGNLDFIATVSYRHIG